MTTRPLLAIALLAALAGCRDSAPTPVAAATPEAAPAAAPAPAPAPGPPAAAPEAAAGGATAPAEAVPQGGTLPAAAAPFPAGLSGTLVFQSDREGRTKIYTIDLASGRVARLTSDTRYHDENPRWSPDGTRILFKSNRAHYLGQAPSPNYDLYVMQADGSGVRRLTTDGANENEAGWHPDGQSVVYTSDRDSRGDLYRLWLADGRVERLTHHFAGRAIMPAVSPDGTKVAFAAQTLNRGTFWLYQVQVLDLATKTTSALDSAGGSCWPAWAPQGASLACVLLDREPSGLELVTPGGGARKTLLAHATQWSYYPDFSPDGRSIAFSTSPAHHDGENWDLAVLAVDKPGAYTPITTGSGNDRLPDWKP